LLQNTQAVFVQIFTGPVDIEYEHRLVLLSADCLSDSAILWGPPRVKTPFSRSSALLSWITLPDQRLFENELDGFGITASLFIFFSHG